MTLTETIALGKGDLVYEVTSPADGKPATVKAWTVADVGAAYLMLSPEGTTAKRLPVHRKSMQRFESTPKMAAVAALMRSQGVVADYEARLRAATRVVDDRRRLMETYP